MEINVFAPGPYRGPLPQLRDRHFDVVHITPDWLTTEKVRSGSGGLGVVSGAQSQEFEDNFEKHQTTQLTVAFYCSHGYQTQKVENNIMVPRYLEDQHPDYVEDTGIRVKLIIDGKDCYVALYQPRDRERNHTAVILLNTDIPENNRYPNFKRITAVLYGERDAMRSVGVSWHDVNYLRVWQNAVLGLGAFYALKECSIDYELAHFNDSHGIFFALHRFGMYVEDGMDDEAALLRVNQETRYTNHTIVEAGNRHYPFSVVLDNLHEHYAGFRKKIFHFLDPKPTFKSELCMTTLAMRLAGPGNVNGVSVEHAEILDQLWPGYNIFAITNGIPDAHVHPEASRLDGPHQIPGFKRFMKYEEGGLLDRLKSHAKEAGYDLAIDMKRMQQQRTVIIGMTRRKTQYKRLGILFHDAENGLMRILHEMGQVAIAYGGYAHGDDIKMRQEWNNRFEIIKTLPNALPVFNYDYELMLWMKAGSDIWVNAPYPFQEACGTSSMSAMRNYSLVLSVLYAGFIQEAREHVKIFGDTSVPVDESVDWNNRYQYDARDLWHKVNEYQVLLRHEDPRTLQFLWDASKFAEEKYSAERKVTDYCTLLYRLPR